MTFFFLKKRSKILCFYGEIGVTLYFAKVDQDYESVKACKNLSSGFYFIFCSLVVCVAACVCADGRVRAVGDS